MVKDLTLYHKVKTFIDPEKEAFWKHCWKRSKCWKPALSFPKMFSTLSKKNCLIWVTMKLSYANACDLDRSKILLYGKGLM